MKTLDLTKLDKTTVLPVVNALQQLLADYQIYYTNLRGFHWNVKGKDFFVLHSEFEKMYNNASDKIDEIAERILMLDGIPQHKFSDYLTLSKISEHEYDSNGDNGIKHVIEVTSHFIASERAIIKLASEANDESTIAMMTDYIKEQEKLLWMLVAYSGK